jgi:hypothetical protein
MEADKPQGADAVELVVDEAFDISFQPLGLLAVMLLYWGFYLGHLSFSCFISRRSTGDLFGTQHLSSVELLAAVAPHSTE